MLQRFISITLVHLLLWMPLAACRSRESSSERSAAGAAGNGSSGTASPGASRASTPPAASSSRPAPPVDWSAPYRGEAPATREIARANLDAFFELMGQIPGTLDRSQFDLEARLDALGWDESNVIEAIAAQIAFQPYRGLLRGAVGTLMSRAGNALDQAVLLATLIKDAGLEARIAHGALSAADARRLAGLTPSHRSPTPASLIPSSAASHRSARRRRSPRPRPGPAPPRRRDSSSPTSPPPASRSIRQTSRPSSSPR